MFWSELPMVGMVTDDRAGSRSDDRALGQRTPLRNTTGLFPNSSVVPGPPGRLQPDRMPTAPKQSARTATFFETDMGLLHPHENVVERDTQRGLRDRFDGDQPHRDRAD